MRPHTFIYIHNRAGVPYRAEEYVCRHGYESQTCGVGFYCPQVGQSMVQWENGVFKQMRERMVVRNNLLNGS